MRERTQVSQVLRAKSWESEVLAKASRGYGSLDEEDLVIRYAAMRLGRIFFRNPASTNENRESEGE